MTSGIYIAGSSREVPRVRAAMDIARLAGLVVTLDWTRDVELVGQANPPDASESDCRRWATADLIAIDRAVFFWLLYPQHPSPGAFFEFGAAWRAGRTLIVSGPGQNGSIFSALAHGRVEDDAEVHALLRAVAPGRNHE